MADSQPADVIRLDQYPLHEPDDERVRALAQDCMEQLADTGCARVERIVRPSAIEQMCAISREASPNAFHSVTEHNPYFGEPDASLDQGDPRRCFQTRRTSVIARDQLPAGAPLDIIHRWSPFMAFLQACLSVEPLYPFKDPISGLTINLMEVDDLLPWHFDTNEFTVSVPLQMPVAGGGFEYVPDVRKPGDECLDDVAQVLAGDRTRVINVEIEPGDLMLFKGRYSLHRVTRVEGARPRFVAFLSYALMPDYIGSPRRVQQVYGRCLPVHLEAERSRVRADSLMD